MQSVNEWPTLLSGVVRNYARLSGDWLTAVVTIARAVFGCLDAGNGTSEPSCTSLINLNEGAYVCMMSFL